MNFCACQKDEDGQCEPCKRQLGGFFGAMISLQKEFFERIDRLKDEHRPQDVCSGCNAMYSDVVMSGFFKTIMKAVPQRALAFQLYIAGVGVCQAAGAKATPHLDEVWRSICGENGWNPGVFLQAPPNG